MLTSVLLRCQSLFSRKWICIISLALGLSSTSLKEILNISAVSFRREAWVSSFHIFFSCCEQFKVIRCHMINRNILTFVAVIDTLDDVHYFFASLCGKAIVIWCWYVYCELLSVLARRNCLAHPSDVFYFNHSFNLLFMNVVDSIICDSQDSFLCPLEHIGLLDLTGKYQFI